MVAEHGLLAKVYSDAPFRVEGSGFRVQGSGIRVQGSGIRVQSLGFGKLTNLQTCLRPVCNTGSKVAIGSKTRRGSSHRTPHPAARAWMPQIAKIHIHLPRGTLNPKPNPYLPGVCRIASEGPYGTFTARFWAPKGPSWRAGVPLRPHDKEHTTIPMV